MKGRQQFGLLGKTLGHSHSPLIYESLGLGGYQLFEMAEEEIEGFLQQPNLAGINVTMPYKQTVMPYCHTLSNTARRLGNVNLLRFDRLGRIHGDNTDYTGLRQTLEQGFDPNGKKVVILGTGGAAHTAMAVAQDMGANHVVCISRRGEHHYGNLELHADGQLLINATPVGMYPHDREAPLSLEHFPRLEGVVDLVYNPLRTRLMLEAEKRGIPAIGGLMMLASQGCAAAEIFLEKQLDQQEVCRVYTALLQKVENILLVGMPGSGKTVVGQALAQQMNRKFVDTDWLLLQKTGLRPPQLVEQRGQQGFRDAEAEVLAEICKESGLIISTGGGAVLREENREVMVQNSRVYWLRRPLEQLAVEGRGFCKDLPGMYAQRQPAYEAASHAAVDACPTPQETARNIAADFYTHTLEQRWNTSAAMVKAEYVTRFYR